jgi:hypothetical protein
MIYFLIAPRLLNENIAGISFVILFGICIVGGVVTSVLEKKERQKMRVIRDNFEKYVMDHLLEYQDFSYPSITQEPPINDLNQIWIVIDKTHELVSFRETSSPFPERYGFFISDKKPGYIFVDDKYGISEYLLH